MTCSRAATARASANLLIMVDGEGELAHENAAERQKAIENHFRWLDCAAYLRLPLDPRRDAGGGGDEAEKQKRAADSLVQLARHADTTGLNVIVENHGGSSSKGDWLAGVMKIANHPRVGTLPDFGNFNIGNGGGALTATRASRSSCRSRRRSARRATSSTRAAKRCTPTTTG